MAIQRLPLVLILAGFAGAAAALWLPTADTRPVYMAIDLSAGATTTVEFYAARGVDHEIGIEMERETAERLFPCTAGHDYHGPVDECPGARLPVSLDISLFENGSDRSDLVSPNTSRAGGSYVYAGRRQTYTWIAAFARLSRGSRYRMVIRSLTDGTAAHPADPWLTVAVNPIDTMEEAILRYFGFRLAIGVGAVGVVWALLSCWLRKRRRQ